jgi:hypothetical protein
MLKVTVVRMRRDAEKMANPDLKSIQTSPGVPKVKIINPNKNAKR